MNEKKHCELDLRITGKDKIDVLKQLLEVQKNIMNDVFEKNTSKSFFKMNIIRSYDMGVSRCVPYLNQ
jgi:hypothetical protein